MVQSCSAYGCKNRYHKDKNISFHKFPLARPDVCGKWLAAMKRRNFKPSKYSNICSQHFTRDCFKRECNNRVLKDNAVPSLFSSSRLQMQAAPLEETLSPDMEFSLSLPLSDAEETPAVRPSEAELCPSTALPDLHTSAFVSCDHNYTVEDTLQQKRRIEQLQEQMEKLRKRLKTVQQKCRRQERQLERFRAMSEVQRDAALGDSYVILPKEIYDVLKGIETIGEHVITQRIQTLPDSQRFIHSPAEGKDIMSIALKQVFNKDKTFRPKRKFEPGTQRFDLHKRAQASLSSGLDLRAAVKLPQGEDLNDWVAVHVVDFFNRINLIYGTVCEFCMEKSCPVMSGGPRYEYRWQDEHKYKKPTPLPAPQYMNLLMDWIEMQINNEDIFPTSI
ncbi:THAP domain-containing protein 1-like, partial [Sinocyclocheilus anshuiensis]|uniref:THAP domain-containing protein 1-like n=1 Tax=Sinocyclocheilus anshuiensis TaxID=1608454 RepID=UPI0007BA7123